MAGGLVLPAGRPRLLPRWQEGPAADRVWAAHRPGRAAGRGAGVPRRHRRPGRLHRDRQGRPGKFKLARMVMVGDRGMITKARIEALNTAADGTPLAGQEAYGWITALRAPAIGRLMADGGPLQMSLFDQQDLAEITSPDYPGERLIACRNPALAADRARKR